MPYDNDEFRSSSLRYPHAWRCYYCCPYGSRGHLRYSKRLLPGRTELLSWPFVFPSTTWGAIYLSSLINRAAIITGSWEFKLDSHGNCASKGFSWGRTVFSS
ncbi:hypothetical protein BJY04DRAFT_49558 [Aspergillus karnatakaensis]|uniref:uncharacterized protein n=1 Tax=Aspergillus karnatakaensis TaxID=1810916 RepID=UPI003CCCCD33